MYNVDIKKKGDIIWLSILTKSLPTKFSFTNQDIEALKRVNELFESIDSILTEEGNPDFIVDSENGEIAIDVDIFSAICETITNLLNFERWEA